MKKVNIFLILSIILVSIEGCTPEKLDKVNRFNSEVVNSIIEDWHGAAAESDLESYFSVMDSTFHYIGTDATENWTKSEFKAFCEPYFEKKSTWDFETISRDVYSNQYGSTAWFDEVLSTQMGICRGSGVLELIKNQWKLKQYVLSVAIPNDDMSEVLKAKAIKDSLQQIELTP